MRLRVVCGLGEMMASFSPTSALSNVDLPAFGAPMTAEKARELLQPDKTVELAR